MTMSPVARGADAGTGDAARLSSGDHVGPFSSADFAITTGRGAALPAAAALYFADEYIAVPRPGVPVARITPGAEPFADAVRGAGAPAGGIERPTLVWAGSQLLLRGARIDAAGTAVEADGRRYVLALAPKLALNRSYFDASSAAFLAQRPLVVRGEADGGRFVARSFWPQDFALDDSRTVEPLAGESPQLALRALMRATADGGAREPFATRLLARRGAPPPAAGGAEASQPSTSADWASRPALAIIVNGAQGDDDEAWGGHFAVATGIVGEGGAIGDFLVNNFYSLDLVSEKGILAAPVPLDRYLADLNSGQGWYRPSFVAVALLDKPRAALAVQQAFARIYLQFWRHRIPYGHATMNCAGISVDVLRALGLAVPARGASSRVAAFFSVPVTLALSRSVADARTNYEYLSEDVTRLLPAAAFEETVAKLVALAQGESRDDGLLSRMLAEDIEAIELLRIPQWPSSRAFGHPPVVTPWEYFDRVPRDPAQRQTVPVPPRAFPDALREPDLPRIAFRRSDVPLLLWLGLAGVLVGWLWRRFGGRG